MTTFRSIEPAFCIHLTTNQSNLQFSMPTVEVGFALSNVHPILTKYLQSFALRKKSPFSSKVGVGGIQMPTGTWVADSELEEKHRVFLVFHSGSRRGYREKLHCKKSNSGNRMTSGSWGDGKTPQNGSTEDGRVCAPAKGLTHSALCFSLLHEALRAKGCQVLGFIEKSFKSGYLYISSWRLKFFQENLWAKTNSYKLNLSHRPVVSNDHRLKTLSSYFRALHRSFILPIIFFSHFPSLPPGQLHSSFWYLLNCHCFQKICPGLVD